MHIRMHRQGTFETGFIRSTLSKSQPKNTGHVTLTTSILRVICHRRLGFDTVYTHTKFETILASAVPKNSYKASKI